MSLCDGDLWGQSPRRKAITANNLRIIHKIEYELGASPQEDYDAVAAWVNVKSGIVDRLMTDRDRAELEKIATND